MKDIGWQLSIELPRPLYIRMDYQKDLLLELELNLLNSYMNFGLCFDK